MIHCKDTDTPEEVLSEISTESEEQEQVVPKVSKNKGEISSFKDFDLPEVILTTLEKMGYEVPTPVQAKGIPLALQGKDILGSAQTGTGKTAAYAIPMIAKLLNNPTHKALVLTPTRELAAQVMTIMKALLGRQKVIKSALLIGGTAMRQQLQSLKENPQVIVGTPGRVFDHLDRKSLNLSETSFLVLDETDRMLDMGFGIQIDAILKFVPQKRQTLLFSATLPAGIVRLANKYLTNPERVAVDADCQPAKNIKQATLEVSENNKYDTLISELNEREGTVIIFVKTKRLASQLSINLQKEKHEARSIHGDMRQNQRDRVVKDFREEKIRILVATDVMARGLDIPHVMHVINYDLPQCPEDYIHRIGRTARAGAEGHALSLISPSDRNKWRAIYYLMNPGEKKSSSSSSRGGYQGGGGGRGYQGGGGGRGYQGGGDRKRAPFGEKSFGGGRTSFGGGGGGGSRGPRFGDSAGRPARDSREGVFEKAGFGSRTPNREGGAERGGFGSRPSGNREGGFERPSFGRSENREGGFGRPSGNREGGAERGGFGSRPSGNREGGFERSGFGGRSENREGGFGRRPDGERGPRGEGGGKSFFNKDKPRGFSGGKPGGFSGGKPGGFSKPFQKKVRSFSPS